MAQITDIAAAKSGSTEAAAFGPRIMALADRLAAWSEAPNGLTCTYLSSAHRAVAAELAALMKNAGLETETDATGNVVGRYKSQTPNARTLIIGSHYDTVRNAGKYDGRLGVLVSLAVAEHLVRQRVALPYDLEVIAFSEEEGVRFAASYIGSSAVAGRFDPKMLERRDADGISLAQALRDAGADPTTIPALARPDGSLLGYLETHIEQGPVLLDAGLPVGVVSAIAGNTRYQVVVEGIAGHAGTVPMGRRRDAAAAAAEIVLLVERRCSWPGLVGTVGQLSVTDGATNLIPGRCELSIDVRSGDDAVRHAATHDILVEIDQIAARRGVTVAVSEVLNERAMPCSARLQELLAAAIARAGLPAQRLPSGAGHDAVMFSGVTDIGVLFVRCGNNGVSHSPREIVTAEDADIAARILLDTLVNLKPA